MPESDVPKPDPGPVYQATGWRVPLLWLAAMIVRAWCRTLRVSYDVPGFRAIHAGPRPLTMMMWHNRLFMVPWLSSRWPGRPVYGLVSASRDGANLARFFTYVGMRAVRGSSSRFGREALRDLITMQRAGHDIAITPDGPRGPIYQLKAGALLAARRTRSPLLLFGIEFRSAWRARSWDRFCVPRPFSRVVLRHELIQPDAIPEGSEGVEYVRRRLLTLSGESVADWPALKDRDTDETAAS